MTVENTNQRPSIGSSITLPDAKQNQMLIYRMPENTFIDNDINLIANDSLSYSIHSLEEKEEDIQWLDIDINDGTITGILKYKCG